MQTPQSQHLKLAKALGLPMVDLWLKREDLHRYGSHKGRSIPVMIKAYVKNGFREFVISSSGNAALAAIHGVISHNKNNPNKQINLTVFIGQSIDKKKKEKLEVLISNFQFSISIFQVKRPKQSAFTLEKESHGKTMFLRQSNDDLALEGYTKLAEELSKIPDLQAVFIPTSSGTTAQALGQTFASMGKEVQIHIVQTSTIHPIADQIKPSPLVGGSRREFRVEDEDSQSSESATSLAGAIVDKIAHRKQAVTDVVKQSNGSAWIISDDELKITLNATKQSLNFPVSPNSALSLAGFKKASNMGWGWNGAVVCLLTGV